MKYCKVLWKYTGIDNWEKSWKHLEVDIFEYNFEDSGGEKNIPDGENGWCKNSEVQSLDPPLNPPISSSRIPVRMYAKSLN